MMKGIMSENSCCWLFLFYFKFFSTCKQFRSRFCNDCYVGINQTSQFYLLTFLLCLRCYVHLIFQVLDMEYLISRQFIQFFGVRLQGHDGDSYPPIIVEEIVLRVIRMVVNAIGIWLVSTVSTRFTFYKI